MVLCVGVAWVGLYVGQAWVRVCVGGAWVSVSVDMVRANCVSMV